MSRRGATLLARFATATGPSAYVAPVTLSRAPSVAPALASAALRGIQPASIVAVGSDRVGHHGTARGFAASATSASPPPPPSAAGAPNASDDAPGNGAVAKHVLYRGPWLLTFRTLVRFKVFQLMGVSSLVVPLTAVFSNEPVATGTAAAVAAVVGGAGACSLALQYYASRYVGELSMVRARGTKHGTNHRTRVRISTMDFWGHRVDKDFDPADVLPPLRDLPADALGEMASQMFVPLDVVGSHQHVLSLRHGDLKDKKRLFALLTGDGLELPKTWKEEEVGGG